MKNYPYNAYNKGDSLNRWTLLFAVRVSRFVQFVTRVIYRTLDSSLSTMFLVVLGLKLFSKQRII